MRHTPHQQAVERRPRLLFLAYFFPPANAIACVRTWNIAKYLARLGWDITVVTLHPSIWRHVDNPEQTNTYLSHEGIRCILTDHRWRSLSPDHLKCWNRGMGWLAGGVCRRIARRFGITRELGWFKAAERACSTLTQDDVDIILASGDPFLAFKLAKLLSDRLRRPYVLDYRDPWTGNLHAAQPDRPATIQLEARLLSHAAAVTIVSRAWSIAMDQRFTLGSKLHVVTNGYDPDEMGRVRSHDFGHFAIVYTGSFYPPKRVISPVMEALARLKATTTGSAGVWYFHYYGDQTDHVATEAQRFGVAERVMLHGRVSRGEALSAVRGAGVAVVITTITEKGTLADNGVVTAKLFEALGLKTPILLIGPPESDGVELIADAGVHASFTGTNIDGISRHILQLMSRQIHPSQITTPQRYAWPELVKPLDALLRSHLPCIGSPL